MSTIATLDVDGVPAPQGSHSAVLRGNRAIVLHGSSNVSRARLSAWRGAVYGEAQRWMQRNKHETSPWDRDTPLAVLMIFRLIAPKTNHDILQYKRPDLDKLLRATNDGLTASGLIADDSRISIITTAKRYVQRYEQPGCEITVRTATTDLLQDAYDLFSEGA